MSYFSKSNYHSALEDNNNIDKKSFPKPFWILWFIELWERFGFYGMQAIIILYFVKNLGFSSKESFYIFGSFSAFCYGFVWIGGLIGDQYLGAKRTLLLGVSILIISYVFISISTKETIFYGLSGIIIGNAIFKANPSSLIAKVYATDSARLDGAMMLYYVAINIGSLIASFIIPMIAQTYNWHYAFLICATGLSIGSLFFLLHLTKLDQIATQAGKEPLKLMRLFKVLIAVCFLVYVIANILIFTALIATLSVFITSLCFIYFIYKAFKLPNEQRNRMLIALILMIQAVMFFALYQQMPTSLTLFIEHSVDRHIGLFLIPSAQFQLLNPFFILIMAPFLGFIFKRFPGSHATKFCFGMTL